MRTNGVTTMFINPDTSVTALEDLFKSMVSHMTG